MRMLAIVATLCACGTVDSYRGGRGSYLSPEQQQCIQTQRDACRAPLGVWPSEPAAWCNCLAHEACGIPWRDVVWDSPAQRERGYDCAQYLESRP